MTSTRIRAIANFVPYPHWKWIEGFFTASLRTCGGSVVQSTTSITHLLYQSSTYTYPWVSNSLARSSQQYYAWVYISPGSALDDGAGNVWALNSVNPIHNTAQIGQSGCFK
jgi:hypothetical protein